jgi:hypothetical protein
VRFVKSQTVHIPSLVDQLREFMGGSLPIIFLEKEDKITDLVNLIYLRSKRNLVEKDLYSFQKEAFKVNSKLWGFVNNRIKRLGADQATSEFLRETVSVLFN